MDPFTAMLAANVVGNIGSAIFGKKKAPQVAAAPQVNIAEASAEAVNANKQIFGSASALAKQTNDFNQAEATRLLDKAIPGFSRIQNTLLKQVEADLSTEGLPAEVQQQIQRFAAEKGISRGTSGGFNQFSLVKDFGFSLTDWNNAKRARALSSLSTIFGMSPRVNPTSPAAMFVDTNTAINVKGTNANAAYNVTQAGYNATADAANYNRSLWVAAGSSFLQAGAYALGGPNSKTPMNGDPRFTRGDATRMGMGP